MSEILDYGLRIGVSGERPGTGSSTLTKSLEEIYQETAMQRYYGGQVRRALAQAWYRYGIQSHKAFKQGEAVSDHTQKVWSEFTQIYAKDPVLALEHLPAYLSNPAGDDTLEIFNQHEKLLSPDESLFDTLPDFYMKDGFNKGPAVLDGKLAVVIDKLTERKTSGARSVFSTHPNLVVPYIRIILTVDDVVGAQRTQQREDAQTLEAKLSQDRTRIKEDWDRYAQNYYYGQTQEPICQEHLEVQPNLITIDTTSNSQEQVMILALNHILGVLEQVKHKARLGEFGANFRIDHVNKLINLSDRALFSQPR